MTPLRVLLADDEAPARRRLARLLDAHADVRLVGEAADGIEAVERIRDLAPDVVLLDIQMPGLDGFGVIDAVGADLMPAVVFVTAYDEHAVRAFEVRALDYLLKPVAPDRLAAALARVRTAGAAPPAALREVVAEREPWLRRVLVEADGRGRLLPVEEIVLVRADRNHVELRTRAGTWRLRMTLAALAARLDPAHFLQVNRSDIVRLDAIREVQAWSHGDRRIVLPDGAAVMWSRRFRARRGGDALLG